MTYNKEVGKAATNKYRSKFDMIQIRVPQGEREKIAEHAAEHGESMNTFVYRAIRETMQKDFQKDVISSNTEMIDIIPEDDGKC